LRIYPKPRSSDAFGGYLDRIWFRFRIEDNSWGENEDVNSGVLGVNNINTLPFDNLPYENINSMGKQWIRNYALALCKEMLGQIRGKFQTVPIPGESVTLNYSSLLSEAQKEKDDLRQSLTEMLKEIEYPELAKKEQEKVTAAEETLRLLPPVRVFALVRFDEEGSSYLDSVGVDSMSQITVHFHKRRLTEDQDLFVREGDFILYGERYYEIIKLSSSRKLFGQVNQTFETSATCKRARKGLFDAT
jgi:hypothetical protein